MSLSATRIKAAKPRGKPYKLYDEKGLYLLVHPNGSKYWRQKYRHLGKERTLALGVYPDISLKDAREGRDDARRLIAKSIDPSAQKRARKNNLAQDEANSIRAVSSEWFSIKMRNRSKSHRDRTWRALEKDIFPYLGDRPIDQITAPELLGVLRKIESRGAIETAHRAKQTIGQVFRYAIAIGSAERDPSSDLRGALSNPSRRHLAAITDPKQVGKLLNAIDGYDGTFVVKIALQLSPLLFCRPGELRHMEWREINWDQARWEIPAEKMKTRQQHIVPLSAQSQTLLRSIEALTGNGRYVFPSARGGSRPLSENGTRTALRTLGYDNETMTPHGFRAMARTLLDEVLGFRIDWIEHQLAHTVKDTNGRAYNRTAHLEQRREMMQTWADYLDELRSKCESDHTER